MSTHSPQRYLALGDSYTIGEGVAEQGRWPVTLVQALHAQGIPLAAPQIIAKTGWTTDELSAAIQAQELQSPYALVSLLIGVNNQYRGRNADDYRDEFPDLLQFAIRMADAKPQHVLVISIPDWGVTTFARNGDRDRQQIATAIDLFNAIAHEECTAAGARFVDITGISRQCADDPAMLAEDGLHPSAAQYACWLPPILAAATDCLAAVPRR